MALFNMSTVINTIFFVSQENVSLTLANLIFLNADNLQRHKNRQPALKESLKWIRT